jgi:murein DD-endopeptidase MepM/ murein hydrolase activator NlpD
MFGYLLNLDSLVYWRDTTIPEAQDMALADPHQFEMVACYSPHAGTDIKAPAGTPVYAAAVDVCY